MTQEDDFFSNMQWGNNYTSHIKKLNDELEAARKEIEQLKRDIETQQTAIDWAARIMESKDKEIERLKGLIEKAYKAGRNDFSYEEWKRFKRNNLL